LLEDDLSPDALVKEFFNDLGLSSLAEWDVLVFLYRHQSSLASAEHIARLLGHPSKEVDVALERLESKNLVKRSRAVRGVHFYQLCSETAITPGNCFRKLNRFADHRLGRLHLIKYLQQSVASPAEAKGTTT